MKQNNESKLFRMKLQIAALTVIPQKNWSMEPAWHGATATTVSASLSDMRLEIGGISYTAAPFNGWYMGTEIGARNLTDEARYDLLPAVAEKLGLNTARDFTLWKDKALVELNIAVLHSYRKHRVSIVDHHTAAQQFVRFQKNETDRGREVTGRWSWLIPPMSPAATSIFHTGFNDTELSPNFFKS